MLEIAQEKKPRGRPKGSKTRPLEERTRIRKAEPPRSEPPARFTGPAARIIALRHAERAISRLAYLIDNAENEQAQIAACKEILDRAYGKAPQAVVGEDGGPVEVRKTIEVVIVDPAKGGGSARIPALIDASPV